MMLSVSELSVHLGRRKILHKLSFNAMAGQVTAIVGPSGAGKSTLLSVLTGDVDFLGSVTLHKRDLKQMSTTQLAEMRAVLLQATPMSFPFTVLEVVRMDRLRRTGCDRITAQALERVGQGGFEGRFYQELSGGEQQRVQLARVLVQVWEPSDPVAHAGCFWMSLSRALILVINCRSCSLFRTLPPKEVL